MEPAFRLVVHGEPIGKARPRFSRKTGTAYTPEKTARYEERLAWAAQAEMAGRKLFDGPLRVSIYAYVSIPASASKRKRADMLAGVIRPVKKPDIDNIVKGVSDALNKVVWVDDSQISHLIASKQYAEQPRIEIDLWMY